MKAIVFARSGDPAEVLELRDVDDPIPARGQIVVEVAARPIHPSDLAFVRGTYRVRPVLPQVAGLSGMGRVVDGDPETGLLRGARVAFRWPGAWAERVAVPVERAFPLPDAITDEDGAQLPLNPITAWGLLDVANAPAGSWVGVTAPGSSVAQLVIALAEMRGVRTVLIERSAEPNLAERIRSLTGGEGLAALLDSVGGSPVERLFTALQPGATIVAYGTLSPEAITVRNATLIYSNLTWRGFGIDRWLASTTPESRRLMLDALYDAMRGRRLPLPVRERHPLAEFRQALQSAAGHERGKVLLATVGGDANPSR